MDEENKLPQQVDSITNDLISEQDPEKTKRLVNLFNLTLVKKNAVRLNTVNELIDAVLDKIGQRLEIRPDEFSNKDLIDYMNALYNAAEKSGKIISGADEIPAIQFNQQNNVIVSPVETLSRESRMKIADAVSAILKQYKNNPEGDLVEVVDSEVSVTDADSSEDGSNG